MKKSILLRLLIVVFCGYMLFSLSTLFGELDKSKEELADIVTEKTETENRIAEKENRIETTPDIELLEQGAYEAGYAYPNEQVFVDVSGN